MFLPVRWLDEDWLRQLSRLFGDHQLPLNWTALLSLEGRPRAQKSILLLRETLGRNGSHEFISCLHFVARAIQDLTKASAWIEKNPQLSLTALFSFGVLALIVRVSALAGSLFGTGAALAAVVRARTVIATAKLCPQLERSYNYPSNRS